DRPLARDAAPALTRYATGPDERLEHRRAGLLQLQEERVTLVPPEQEVDPAARTDTADADDLAGDVDAVELVEQRPAVGWERPAIARERGVDQLVRPVGPDLGQRHEGRRLGTDAWPSAAVAGERGERASPVVPAGLPDALLELVRELRVVRIRERAQAHVRVEPRVPELQVSQPCELPYRLAVRPNDA